MIFYKLLCIPPNLEIFLTSVYSFWCLCSQEILSFDRLVDKINVCWSTNNLEENLIVIYLRYAVSSVHIFQFIFAYVMLAAAIMTIYPILFNKSATLLNPIIIASTFRQIYLNSVAVILGALLCYFSGSNFKEFQWFFGKFLVNIVLSYYIIYSFEDFRKYVIRRSSHIPAVQQEVQRGLQREEIATKYTIHETKSENILSSNWNYRPEKKVKPYRYNDDLINQTNVSSNRNKILSSESDFQDGVESFLSTTSIPTTATDGNVKETFKINFIDHKTKANLLSFTISKKN